MQVFLSVFDQKLGHFLVFLRFDTNLSHPWLHVDNNLGLFALDDIHSIISVVKLLLNLMCDFVFSLVLEELS